MSSRKSIVIGLDVGTTNVKAVALDTEGTLVAETSRPIATSAPHPGWIEQDPEAMLDYAVDCARRALDAAERHPSDVAALGIASQTETLVVWDRRTGRPLLPAVIWQCRRGGAEIERLHTPESVALIKARTGLDLDPTFTAAKLKWVLTHRPEIAEGLRSGDVLFGTVDTWLIWRLTGGETYATEPSNASRTMLFDIDRMRFDPELISLFGLDLAQLPECRPSNASFGVTDASVLSAPVPIYAALGDQQASLFGHGCFEPMQLKISYGTGAFLWVNAGADARSAPAPGIIRTVAWQIDRPCYAFEGFIMYAGKILEWLGARLKVEGGAATIAVEAEAARTSAGVSLVPAFQGLASPWWEPELRAALLGMSEATAVGHIAHAGLEAVCYQVRAVLDAMPREPGVALPPIKVDGGMGRSSYFLQLQADILRTPLSRAGSASVAGVGAALMAGLGVGLWRSLDELRGLIPEGRMVLPQAEAAPCLQQSYADWLSAIRMLTGEYGRAG